MTGFSISYYRPQTKFAKVMFLHASVSHSVHAWLPGGVHGWGDMRGCRGCAWLWGACMVAGGHEWLLRGGGVRVWNMTRYGQ